jgi:DNA-binding NarL/FixJ family response regulator
MGDAMATPVFIVDDHPSVREGLRGLVERSERYRVTGAAASAEEALATLGSAGTEAPELCLVDLNLPGMGGIDLVARLRSELPALRCLVISMSIRFEHVVEACAAGAFGFVGKDQDGDAIVRCLDAAHRGELGLEGPVLRMVIDNARRLSRSAASAERARFDSLTPREKDVFKLVALDRSAWEIAVDLGLSSKTVENVKSSISSKLGMHDRLEIYRYAVKLGVVEVLDRG